MCGRITMGEWRKKKTDVDNENEDDGGGGVALTEVDTSNTNTNNGNSQNSNSNIELVECIVIKGTVKEDAWIDHFVNIFTNVEVKCTTRSSRTTKNRKSSWRSKSKRKIESVLFHRVCN